MTHYDVIIIGTGAGGGTLAYRLAPSGKRILLLERGDYVRAREGQLELARGQRRGEVPHQGGVARQGRQAAPSAHQLLRRRQHQVLRRGAVPPARARTSASCGITAACRRRGRSATTSSSRTTPRPSTCIRCTASAASIRPSRGRARRIRFPAVSHEPRIQQLHDDLSRQRACGRSTCRSASCSTRANPQQQPLHPLRHLRRLPLPDPRQERRAGRLRRSGAGHPNVTLADQRAGRRGSRPARRAAR